MKCIHEWRHVESPASETMFFYCIHCLAEAKQDTVTLEYTIKFANQGVDEE